MKQKVELLAPVGDFECLKAAVQNGADSVYFGGSLFNARAAATNFDDEELKKVIEYCALRNVKTHLTLNILMKDSELHEAVMLAKKAYEAGIDAIIVQDVGLAQLLRKLFPDLPLHASTQMTVHNLEGVQELEKLGYSRAVLSRELSIAEIEYICANSKIEIETFIHGALCISYSGQCFFSSMVGGRSGNRGRCAQPCRLPYELMEKKETPCNNKEDYSNNTRLTETVIDKGYLISPRDLCSLEYLPQLIQAGVTCFKIEGRLKSPEYVATVTRIYRKYIDMVLSKQEYVVDEADLMELKQIFNRGGFSSGHLSNHENRDLVFKEKPNNMGLYIGNVAGYNKLKGHIKLLLNENLAIGDTINFEKENTKYTVSELMQKNANIPSASIGQTVIIGRMKGNIHVGDKVYKLSSKTQLEKARESYRTENKKLPLACHITVKKGSPIELEAYIVMPENKDYHRLSVRVQSSLVPEEAVNSPITKERIISQINKTTDTPFAFKEINVDLEENVFILSIKELNEIRRMALTKLENLILSQHARRTHLEECEIKAECNKYIVSGLRKIVEDATTDAGRTVSAYFNIIHPEFDYSKLSKKYISCAYVPLRYFIRKENIPALQTITANFPTYIYMPAIVKANYKNIVKHFLEDMLKQYPIAGFVVASLGDFVLLENYKKKYEFIGNFTLNDFNVASSIAFQKLGVSKITLSPELNLEDIEQMQQTLKGHMPLELIVYGNVPIMKMNYCLLGVSNKCYPTCKMRCQTNNAYYLRDRLGFEFRILPDNLQTVTTIFNSKTTSITHVDTGFSSLRIDLLDETIEEINTIAKAAYLGEKLDGKQYTYGNLNREV